MLSNLVRIVIRLSLPMMYRKCYFFFLLLIRIHIKILIFVDYIEMPLSILRLEFITESKTSINNSMLFALPAT